MDAGAEQETDGKSARRSERAMTTADLPGRAPHARPNDVAGNHAGGRKSAGRGGPIFGLQGDPGEGASSGSMVGGPFISPEDGARREALEEACANIRIDRLLAVYSVPRLSQVQLMFRARGPHR